MTRRSYEHHLPPRELWPTIVRDTPELRYPPMLNLATALLDTHVEHGASKRTAIVGNDGRMTYGDLQVMTNRIGHALRRLGAEPGDRVLMRFLNGPLFVATWLAVQKIGAIGVSTMPMLRARELAYIINDAEAGVVVCQHDLLDELAHSRSAIDHDIVVVAGGRRSDAGKSAAADRWLEEMIAAAPDRLEPAAVASTDVALIAYTSGSTGPPKGATHTPADILAAAD